MLSSSHVVERPSQEDVLIPFTPFHFGPGIFVKAIQPQRFWLTSFVMANVLIDTEVLYYLALDSPPLHRHFHTYIGGLVAGIISGLAVPPAYRAASRISRWLTRRNRDSRGKLAKAQLRASVFAGTVGGISHVLLDSMMHADMNPFWPFASGNSLAGVVGSATLHGALAICGLLGGALWLLSMTASRDIE